MFLSKLAFARFFGFLVLVSSVLTVAVSAACVDGGVQAFKETNGVKTAFSAFSIPTASKLSSYDVNQPFSVDGITELSLNVGQVKALAASGSVELLGDNSLVRIVLVDSNGNERLVLESYSVLDAKQKKFNFNNLCEEACALDAAATPAKLRIQVVNAKLSLGCLSYLPASKSASLSQNAVQLKAQQDAFKIAAFNNNYAAGLQKWLAGNTGVSAYSYTQKKKLFTKADKTPVDVLPNLQGFEYYKNGIFEIRAGGATAQSFASDDNGEQMIVFATATPTPDSIVFPSSGPRPSPTPGPTVLPPSWDWRNRHGENWMTPVKNQGGVGTCGHFSNVGAFEAQINLYYNRHLEVDLSEQMSVDAGNPGSAPFCGWPSQCSGQNQNPACKNVFVGLADEACDPYAQRMPTGSCEPQYVCSDWQNRVWRTSSFQVYDFINQNPLSKEEFKKLIIQKGPMSTTYIPWFHFMVLVGYQEVPGLTETVWIFKNSWGVEWGEAGYGRISAPLGRQGIGSADLSLPPINNPVSIPNPGINCVDRDSDSYCNWGIGTKPSTCPSQCKSEPDCDDSNPNLGPFVSSTDFNCKIISVNRVTLPISAGAPPAQQDYLPYWVAGIVGLLVVVGALVWHYKTSKKH